MFAWSLSSNSIGLSRFLLFLFVSHRFVYQLSVFRVVNRKKMNIMLLISWIPTQKKSWLRLRTIHHFQLIRRSFFSGSCLCLSVVNCRGILFHRQKSFVKREDPLEKGSASMWCNQSQLKLWMTSTKRTKQLIEMHDQNVMRFVVFVCNREVDFQIRNTEKIRRPLIISLHSVPLQHFCGVNIIFNLLHEDDSRISHEKSCSICGHRFHHASLS